MSFHIVQAHLPVDEQIHDITHQIQRQPEQVELYVKRGELHRVRREWNAALADYERSRELAPDLVLVDRLMGRLFVESGRPAEAMVSLDRYLARRPEDVVALAFRGRARSALGDPQGAVRDLQQAVSASPRPSSHLYLERARAQRAAGSPVEALQGLEDGLARLNRPVTLELEALDLERELGRSDAALARLDRLARSTQRPEPWLVRKAELLEQSGEIAAARHVYGEARRGLEALPGHLRKRGSLMRLAVEIDAGLARTAAAETEGSDG
jgi:tetratricopeptide (TPR) repeat protein